MEDKIAELEAQLQEAQDKKMKLEADVQKCKDHMVAAAELLDGLANEEISWKERAIKLREESVFILGDTVLSSGIIAYLGALPKDYRDELIEMWKKMIEKNKIIFDPEFSLRKICSNENTIGSWVDNFALPNDSISIDNAIIMMKSQRFPLIIDPQEQANRWIHNMY